MLITLKTFNGHNINDGSSYQAMLLNPSKPLISDRIRIFGASRVEEYTLSARDLRDYFLLVENELPASTTVAFYSPGPIWDYVLFGRHFTRRVIPVVDRSRLTDSEWLQREGVDYILVHRPDSGWPAISPLFSGVQEVDATWRLYQRK